jgi:hypothetical protein
MSHSNLYEILRTALAMVANVNLFNIMLNKVPVVVDYTPIDRTPQHRFCL